jgi:hypothetical protein
MATCFVLYCSRYPVCISYYFDIPSINSNEKDIGKELTWEDEPVEI